MNSQPQDEQVVAPYATALALPFHPQAGLGNLRRLIELDMLGPYGFYEAIDFTPARIPPGKPGAVVPIYMTHHQGMILLSLTNCLEGQVMVRRFHADPRIQTVELLLWEPPLRHPNVPGQRWNEQRPEYSLKDRPLPARPEGWREEEGLEVELKSS